jgi:dTDP-4-amino-4,6-dideoxygalactose transaminase
MEIPFLDLVTPHLELEQELVDVVRRTLRSGRFIGGPEVEGFEREYAAFCGTQHCVTVGSGTDALRFALMAAGIGDGDVVVTVPNTFIATTEAISQSGARIDFVDVDERTCNMSPEALRAYLDTERGSRAKAVIPVHLYGQMADMDPILDLAARHNLIVIEDACQAHGAEYYSGKLQRWCRAGSLGSAAAFSFYPGKNLGACGEGGAVTTNDAAIAKCVRMLRDHGQAKKYLHEMEGYNGRMDAMQCGLLRIKLRHLDEWNEGRRKAAARYAKLLLAMEGVILPGQPRWSNPTFHLYVIRAAVREALQQHLAEHGIGTGLHYPIPLHLQPAYAGKGFRRGDFPITEMLAREILSLPMFPQLTPEQQAFIASEVAGFVGERQQQFAANYV